MRCSEDDTSAQTRFWELWLTFQPHVHTGGTMPELSRLQRHDTPTVQAAQPRHTFPRLGPSHHSMMGRTGAQADGLTRPQESSRAGHGG